MEAAFTDPYADPNLTYRLGTTVQTSTAVDPTVEPNIENTGPNLAMYEPAGADHAPDNSEVTPPEIPKPMTFDVAADFPRDPYRNNGTEEYLRNQA